MRSFLRKCSSGDQDICRFKPIGPRSNRFTLAECMLSVAVVGICTTAVTPIFAQAKVSSAGLAANKAVFYSSAMYGEMFENLNSTPCLQEGSSFVNDLGGCLDTASGLVWSGSIHVARGDGTFPNWYEARDYCLALTDGGYTDWRLPTLAEMQSASTRGVSYFVQQAYDANGRYEGGPWWANFSGSTLKGKKVYAVDLWNGYTIETLIESKGKGGTIYSHLDANCVR